MVLLAGVERVSSQTSQSLQNQLSRSRGGALDIQVLQGTFSRRPEIRQLLRSHIEKYVPNLGGRSELDVLADLRQQIADDNFISCN